MTLEARVSSLTAFQIPLPSETVSHDKSPMAVLLSAAKHLAFSVTYEDEILRTSRQNDIPTESLWQRGRVRMKRARL
jgi:hypothetical protein